MHRNNISICVSLRGSVDDNLFAHFIFLLFSLFYDLSALLIQLSCLETSLVSVELFAAHTLGLLSSFDSVPAGSRQRCSGQDENGGDWGKSSSAHFFAVWDVFGINISRWCDVTAVLFASFQLESLKRKRTGWAGRATERGGPGRKSCGIFSALNAAGLRPPLRRAWSVQNAWS